MEPLKVKIPTALLSPERVRRIREALSVGLGQRPDVVVALALGVSYVTVVRYRRDIGLGHTVGAIREGIRHTFEGRQTDEALVRKIRRLAPRGYSRHAIALRLRTTANRVKRLADAHHIPLREFTCGPRRRSERAARGHTKGRNLADLSWGLQRRWRAYQEGTYTGGSRCPDWSLRDEQIARMLGVGARTIRLWRRKLRDRGVHVPPQPRHPVFKRPDWREVDWTQPNAEIGRRYGVDAAAVSAWRKVFRRRGHPIPHAPFPEKKAWLRKVARLAPRIRALAGKGLHLSAISREMGVARSVLVDLVKAAGIVVKAAWHRLDWSRVDWKRSNREIAKDLGVRHLRVACMRCRLRKRGLPIPCDPNEPHKRWHDGPEAMAEAIRKLAAKGHHIMRITRELGIAWSSVRKLADKHAIQIPLADRRVVGRR